MKTSSRWKARVGAIKSRKIFPWLLAYCIAAGSLLELVDLLSEHFKWSEYLFDIAFILCLGGVPGTTVFAWYHGKKGRQRFQKKELVTYALFFSLALIGIILRFVYISNEASQSYPQTIRSFIHPPESTFFAYDGSGGSHIALSPNGKVLAFVATDSEGNKYLWIRQLSSLTAQQISGTEGANYPFWSPDSRFVGFFAEGKLKRIDIFGEQPLTICNAAMGWSGTWGRNDIILFSTSPPSVIYQVTAAGGEPIAVTMLDTTRHEWTHLWPQFLPDGDHFLYLTDIARGGMGIREGAIYISSLSARKQNSPGKINPQFLFNSQSNVAYSSGYLLFLHEKTLVAQPFDVKNLKLKGDAVVIANQVQYENALGRGIFSASNNGNMVYQENIEYVQSQLAWYDRKGKQIEVIDQAASFEDPELSPGGERLAVSRVDVSNGNVDIWIYKLSRSGKIRFTFSSDFDDDPIWSPDGKKLVFASNGNLYHKPSSGAGNKELLLETSSDKIPNDWSIDGQLILYTSRDQVRRNLWIFPLLNDRKPFPLSNSKFTELHGQFSPDVRWIAYTTNETGNYEIFVRSFPTRGGKWQISTNGGVMPRWTREGKELCYISTDGNLMAVEVDGDSSIFEADTPRKLFQSGISDLTNPRHVYDITADGQYLIMNTTVYEKNLPIILVVNWVEELKNK